jgi:deferrochelatase/peroxidase EfeB
LSGGPRVTRRALLGTAAAGGVAGAAGGFAIGQADANDDSDQTVEFHGAHQAGITTPSQDRLHFAAFDLTTKDPKELVDLLRTWTQASERMTGGRRAGPDAGRLTPPQDTGEAVGLHPARLTITIGFGPSLFDKRFGLSKLRPEQLRELPPISGDELNPDISDGDICVQACADDPQVAFHAVRNLTRLASGVAVMRWCQLGFGRTARTSDSQATPRNLMGFKDGTNNILAQDTERLNEHVWVGSEAPGWMRGGSYLVARRIRMLIEAWDRDYLSDQEAVFGRQKVTGAPLGGVKERDVPDFAARNGDTGEPMIATDAHIRLVSHENNNGVKILRRGYSYTDGMFSDSGELDAGLFFIAFQRDPRTQFVPLQRKLSASDALNEYIEHVGSGLYACPPGATGPDDFWGKALFA